MRLIARFLFLLFLVSGGKLAGFEALPETCNNPELYKKLNLVPMPKQLKLTGKKLFFDSPVRIVLGKNKSRQSEIGAQWIQKKIKRNGSMRPVLSETPSPQAWDIIIGDPEDNPYIKKAVKNKIVNTGKNNPGKRGYEIRIDENNKDIYLVGADPVGCLYSCVTFSEMLNKNSGKTYWPMAEIRDWPDVLYVGPSLNNIYIETLSVVLKGTAPGATKKDKREMAEALKKRCDYLLRRKFSVMMFRRLPKLYGQKFKSENWKRFKVYREVIKYAKERGILTMHYAEHPFVGLKKDYPEYVKYDVLPSILKTYDKWIRCWGLDDIRKKTAGHQAAHAKYFDMGFVGFHDSDLHGLTNPAQWEDRSEQDRKRWGNDYAGATINKYMIYFKELNRVCPNIKIMCTMVPYMPSDFDRKKLKKEIQERYGNIKNIDELADKLYKRNTEMIIQAHKTFPMNVRWCLRESHVSDIENFNKFIPGRPSYFWIATDILWPLFSESTARIKTFCCNRDNLLTSSYCDPLILLNSLAIRQYSWNRKTMGNGDWKYSYTWSQERSKEALKAIKKDDPVYQVILPYLLRNIFGTEFGTGIAKAYQKGKLIPASLRGYFRSPYLKPLINNATQMKRQMEIASSGADILDDVWKQFMKDKTSLSPRQTMMLIYLRETFHQSKWQAQIKLQNLLARDSAEKGKIKEAEQNARKGLKLIPEAKKNMRVLIEERKWFKYNIFKYYENTAKNLKKRLGKKFPSFLSKTPPVLWYLELAAVADFSKTASDLNNTMKEIPFLANKTRHLSPMLKKERIFRRRRILAVPLGKENIEIDGILNEPAWKKAFPIESFNVNTKDLKLAQSFTKVRTVYNNKNLYIAFECYAPEGLKMDDSDKVEIFLENPAQKNGYAHLKICRSGKISQKFMNMKILKGIPIKNRDLNWKCKGLLCKVKQENDNKYIVELKIPFSSIGDSIKGIKANYCRISKCGSIIEPSSTMPYQEKLSFHNYKLFREIKWLKNNQEFSPDININLEDLSIKTELMTTGAASIARFKLHVESNTVLHNVKATVTGYNSKGEKTGSRELTTLKIINYSNKSKILVYEFPLVIKKGALKISIKSDEGSAERLFRLNDWQGKADDSASCYSAGKFGKALAYPCYFHTEKADGKKRDIFEGSQGTVEFWLKLNYKYDYFSREIKKILFCWGTTAHTRAPFQLWLKSGETGGLCCYFSSMVSYMRFSAPYVISKENQWRHLAITWHSDRKDRKKITEFFIDAKKVARTAYYESGKKRKIFIDLVNIFRKSLPYPVQIGCSSNGSFPAKAEFDELRISRTARYSKDFQPPEKEYVPDEYTSALFHFNGNLTGQGISSKDKSPYQIKALTGFPELIFLSR